ncbi:hypothetical protein [Agrococcus beijingensis]|uniref:hypothetical protein n=1 Tax=Agrococcus beijingensis TaxID=3068634 RepID=UPI002741E7F5|nr:hypothetical protein [Agrococcus sp. REN33]
MPPHQAYGGITAARLWGLPIRHPWEAEEPLVIARVNGTSRGRAVGTRAIAVHQGLWRPAQHHGLQLLPPAVTALTLARELDHEALVQVVDALLTDSLRYPDLALPTRPHMTLEQARAFAALCGGLVGARALAAAVDDGRAGVDSRFETITRLLIVAAGLPEPEVHPLVAIDGLELHPDLGYPAWRIGIEYEGKQHLDTVRRDGDIDRYALFEAAGWLTVPVTKGDMARRGARFLARLQRTIARRA